MDDLDAVPLEVPPDDGVLALDHEAFAMHELLDGQAGRERVVESVESALAEPGDVERGLAQGLGRHRARIDGGATEDGFTLDEQNPLAEIGCLGRALLAGGAGPDYDEVVRRRWHHSSGPNRGPIFGRAGRRCQPRSRFARADPWAPITGARQFGKSLQWGWAHSRRPSERGCAEASSGEHVCAVEIRNCKRLCRP